MKNRKHTPHALPAAIRTQGSRKLAGSKWNKTAHGKSPFTFGPWDKSQCGCGYLTVACPNLRDLFVWNRDRYTYFRRENQSVYVGTRMSDLIETYRELFDARLG